jgi:TonB family protein
MKWKSWSVLILMLAMVCTSAMAEGRKVVKQKTPTYPEIARTMQLHGSVTLQLTVAPSGKVVETRILGGHPVLAEAAKDAVHDWVFEPSAVATTETVKINFND